jgi:hypothetical protein
VVALVLFEGRVEGTHMEDNDRQFQEVLKTLKFTDSLELDAEYYGNLDSWSFPESVALLSLPGRSRPRTQEEIVRYIESSIRANDILLIASVLPPLEIDDDEPHFRPILFTKWAMSKGFHVDRELLRVLKNRGMPSISPSDLSEKIREIYESAQEQQAKISTTDSVEADKKKEGKHGFALKLKAWNQVKFFVFSKKPVFETYADGQFFSVSDLTDSGLSERHLKFLYQIVWKNGFFDKDSFPENKNLSQSVTRLNEILQKTFKINDAPIRYDKKAKGYIASFQTKADSSG